MEGKQVSYNRMTEGERNQIYAHLQAGKGNNEIARLLGRDKGAVSREIKRNGGRGRYRPGDAQKQAASRACRPGARRFTPAIRKDAEAKLRMRWTPEMICARARLEKRPHVCKETLYKHVYADARAGGTLWTFLPRARRKRRRRCPRMDGRGRGIIPGRRMIGQRPASVEGRRHVGHWEGDLVNGAAKTGHLATLVERKTRFTLLGWVPGKEAEGPPALLCGRLRRIPAKARKSVTFDNGKEFALHERIALLTGMDVYFANPYHSWERGSNENVNGLVRRVYPKGSSFAGMGPRELSRLDSFLNDRPRKCLGWRTPREVLRRLLSVCV
jgi:IS30 family transposase